MAKTYIVTVPEGYENPPDGFPMVQQDAIPRFRAKDWMVGDELVSTDVPSDGLKALIAKGILIEKET